MASRPSMPRSSLSDGPQRGGFAEAAGTQLQSHQGGEGVFGRAAGGAAAPDRLAERRGGGQELLGGRRGEFVHPAFNEGQGGLQLFQGLFLGRRPLGHEDALGQGLLDAFGVAGVEVPGELLDPGGVNVDAAGVGLDGAQQVPAQPGNLDEQAGVGCFADGEEQPDVVLGQARGPRRIWPRWPAAAPFPGRPAERRCPWS